MVLYSFSRYFGQDKLVVFDGSIDATEGDLLLIGGEYFLCLGEEVAWGCDYRMQELEVHIAEPGLLSSSSLVLLHRIVKQYFSSYKHSLPLFLGNDLEQLLKRKVSTKQSNILIQGDTTHGAFHEHKNTTGQSLLLFPNVWDIYAYLHHRIDTQQLILLTGKHTEKQKNEAFWGIKEGRICTLACTHAGLFKDWSHLHHISVLDPHAWYYKNRQDPRYDSVEVCQKVAELYGVEVMFVS